MINYNMGKVRIPRHRVTVVTSDDRRCVTCDRRIVTTAVSWTRNCLKSVCKRMRRPLTIIFVGLLATSAWALFLEVLDPPPPPPVPDEAATLLAVDTLAEDDTVTAIERELERDLGQAHRHQIPAASSFDRHVDEVARVVAVHIKGFQD